MEFSSGGVLAESAIIVLSWVFV